MDAKLPGACGSQAQDVFRVHLYKACARKWRRILFDLLVVDAGKKPGFLFDHGSVTPENMAKLVSDLHQLGYLKNRLLIVSLEQEVFICNIVAFRLYVNWIQSQGTLPIVDVTGHIKQPVLLENSAARKILQQLLNSSKHLLELPEHDDGEDRNCNLDIVCIDSDLGDVNRSTLYGFLIGYPSLYWYSGDCETNCLAMQSLRRFSLSCSIHTHNSSTCSLSLGEGTAYSFTVPENLISILNPVVKVWYNHILAGECHQTKLCSNFHLDEDTVIWASVIL